VVATLAGALPLDAAAAGLALAGGRTADWIFSIWLAALIMPRFDGVSITSTV
jgi:hypothetical protein